MEKLSYNTQLAPAVQLQLMLAGATTGLKYGFVQSVSPLATVEHAKDLALTSEIDAIRSAAEKEQSIAGRGKGGEGIGVVVAEGGVVADEAKELVSV